MTGRTPEQEIIRLRAEIASWTAAHAAMVRERDARIVPGRCLAKGDAQRPDGPRCENVGEFKCFDCCGWLCRDHARWHFDGETEGLRARVAWLTKELSGGSSPESDGYIPQTELEKVRLGAIEKMDGGDA